MQENIPYDLDIEYFIDKDPKPDGQKLVILIIVPY